VECDRGTSGDDQDFVFDLVEAWDYLDAFRLYVVCLTKAKEGYDFSGCCSFSIRDVAVQPPAERPRWWWLLPESTGMNRCEPVEQMIVAADPSKMKPDVVVHGRASTFPLSKINGEYQWQSDECDGKATWKHVTRLIFIYFNRRKEAWCIGDCIGGIAPYAYLEGSNAAPDRCRGNWSVFSQDDGIERKREVKVNPKLKDEAGFYKVDDELGCKRKSAVGRVTTSSERGKQIVKLIASQERFLDEMTRLTIYAQEFENVLLDDDYPGGHAAVFDAVQMIEKVSMFFYEQLVRGQVSDPEFEMPIGPMLSHVAELMRAPLMTYCSELMGKIRAVQTMQFESTSSHISGDAASISAAMQMPFLQIQRYPHFVLGIMKASELGMKATIAMDMKDMRRALMTFREMSAQALELASVVREIPVPIDDEHLLGSVIDPKIPAWFHGLLSKDAAVNALNGRPHASFLVRQRPGKKPPTPFALALVVNNSTSSASYITHHAIGRERDGRFLVRNVSFGQVMSLTDLIDILRLPRPSWPVRLRDFVPRGGATQEQVDTELKRAELLLMAANIDPGQPDPTPNEGKLFGEDLEAEGDAMIEAPKVSMAEVIHYSVGDLVMAPFTDDFDGTSGMYKAEVRQVGDARMAYVLFVEYGNTDEVSLNLCTPFDAEAEAEKLAKEKERQAAIEAQIAAEEEAERARQEMAASLIREEAAIKAAAEEKLARELAEMEFERAKIEAEKERVAKELEIQAIKAAAAKAAEAEAEKIAQAKADADEKAVDDLAKAEAKHAADKAKKRAAKAANKARKKAKEADELNEQDLVKKGKAKVEKEESQTAQENTAKSDVHDQSPADDGLYETVDNDESDSHYEMPVAMLAEKEGDKFEKFSRLQLVKACKDGGLEYKGISKDVDAMKALLRANSGTIDDPLHLVAEESTNEMPATNPFDSGISADADTETNPFVDAAPSKAVDIDLPVLKKWEKEDVGARCTVEGYEGPGTIMFVGKHHETGKGRVGVEMDQPVGKFGGTMKGHEYFVCDKKHGVLVPSKKVFAVKAPKKKKKKSKKTATAATSDELDGISRLGLVKLCRKHALDYKGVAKDVEALKALLRKAGITVAD
jgi:hypothetical protein